MSFGYHFANAAVNGFLSFRDKGWEQALKDASDMIVHLGWDKKEDEPAVGPLEPCESPIQEMSSEFITNVFGHMTPPMTPMMPRGQNISFGRSLSFT